MTEPRNSPDRCSAYNCNRPREDLRFRRCVRCRGIEARYKRRKRRRLAKRATQIENYLALVPKRLRALAEYAAGPCRRRLNWIVHEGYITLPDVKYDDDDLHKIILMEGRQFWNPWLVNPHKSLSWDEIIAWLKQPGMLDEIRSLRYL